MAEAALKQECEPEGELERTLLDTMNIFKAQRGSVMIPNKQGKLVIAASYGIDPFTIQLTCLDGQCTKGYGSVSPCVYNTGEARLVKTEEGVVGVPYTSNSMCVPIQKGGVIVGVLSLSNRMGGEYAFSDLQFAKELAYDFADIIQTGYCQLVKCDYKKCQDNNKVQEVCAQ